MVGAVHQEVVAVLGLHNVVPDGVELDVISSRPQGIHCEVRGAGVVQCL